MYDIAIIVAVLIGISIVAQCVSKRRGEDGFWLYTLKIVPAQAKEKVFLLKS